MEVLAPFLRGRALAALAGVALLMPVVWLFGPLLSFGDFRPLEGDLNRLALCAVLFVLCLAAIWARDRRQRRRDDALITGAAAADPAAERVAEEEAEMRERLVSALAKLKRAGGRKGGYLYEQPWYVIIGPPGSGKTTALANSGLEFPLDEGAKLRGVGGTRFCEWWLTDRAVLIDTAGRYTTQDSDAAADKAGWERFLALLKRNRPRLPLNGVLVAFGVDMLSRLSDGEREEHSRTVRRRIKELEIQLGQRLPVYFLVSKADLLPGFVEFFDDLDKAGREQVWGVTFPAASETPGVAARFAEEFQLLLKRLQDRVLERLQQERGPQQRAALAGFPAQFATLEQPLAAFLAAGFGGTRLEPAPFLRGVYFTSGTQEGSPLDRLSGALSRAFGLDPRRPAAVMGQKGRAYFLGHLLKDVVFNEARLAAGDRGLGNRRRAVALAAWGGALLLLSSAGLYGWSAWSAERERGLRLAEQVAKAEQAARGLPLDRVSDGDLTRVLPYLAAARDLPAAARGDGPALALSQQPKLLTGAENAYSRALDRSFLPRLLARLEAQVRLGFQRPDFLYEAVRVYLMLGREGPLDAPMVKQWFAADWARTHPGAVGQPTRQELAEHLDALLAQNFHRYPLDGALVDQARRVFSRLPLAERVYSRLRPLGQNLQPWRPADVLGQAGQRYFVRASGRPLTEGVPGLYTVDGLHRTLLPALGRAVRDGAAESWVLGAEAANASAVDPLRLEEAVLTLYAEEYARQWQAALGDLALAPFSDLKAAAEGLNLLGAPSSPLRDLVRAIARQLSPGTPPEGSPPPRNGAAPEPTGAAPVGRVVEARFRQLRDAAGQPLDNALLIVNDLYVLAAQLANAPPGMAPPPPPPGQLGPVQRLAAEAARQPEPVGRWLRDTSLTVGALVAGGAKAGIAAAGAQQLAPFCRGLEQRFPFRLDGSDMPIDDFIRLFGPGGIFDQFFTQHIRPHLDVAQSPWRPVATGGPQPVTAQDAAQFQRAAAIRDAFFPGAGMVGIRVELVPQGFDPNAQGAVLEAEGLRTEITRQGPFRPLPLAWPARGNVTLTFDPPSAAGPLAFDGGWAALRLAMRRGSTLQATPARERLRLTVQQGDRSMAFDLRAGSMVHPFGLRDLQDFRCPTLAP